MVQPRWVHQFKHQNCTWMEDHSGTPGAGIGLVINAAKRQDDSATGGCVVPVSIL